MSRPFFIWIGDAADAQAGTAKWTVGDSEVTLRFESFARAHLMDRLVRAAYEAGGEDGKAQIKARLDQALKEAMA